MYASYVSWCKLCEIPPPLYIRLLNGPVTRQSTWTAMKNRSKKFRASTTLYYLGELNIGFPVHFELGAGKPG